MKNKCKKNVKIPYCCTNWPGRQRGLFRPSAGLPWLKNRWSVKTPQGETTRIKTIINKYLLVCSRTMKRSWTAEFAGYSRLQSKVKGIPLKSIDVNYIWHFLTFYNHEMIAHWHRSSKIRWTIFKSAPSLEFSPFMKRCPLLPLRYWKRRLKYVNIS